MQKVGLDEWVKKANISRKELRARLTELEKRFDAKFNLIDEILKRLDGLENPPIPPIRGTKTTKRKGKNA